MIRLRYKLLSKGYRLLDQGILWATAAGTANIQQVRHSFLGADPLDEAQIVTYAIAIFAIAAGWVAIFHQSMGYKVSRLSPLINQVRGIVLASGLSALLLAAGSGIVFQGCYDGRSIAGFFGIVSLVGVGTRCSLDVLLKNYRQSGDHQRHILIVGTNDQAIDIAKKINQNATLGFKTVGFVSEEPTPASSINQTLQHEHPTLGSVSQLKSIMSDRRVDEIMICLSSNAKLSDVGKIVQCARDIGIVARVVPDQKTNEWFGQLQLERLGKHHILTFFREKLLVQHMLKRAIDIVGSILLLAVLSPVMVVTAVLIKVTSSGPILFAQERVGINQRPFRLFKFRSMVADAEWQKKGIQHLNEQTGPVFKIRDDPRVTTFGRLLRKTSIDELPQLFNVLRGEMSLVGPRPPLLEEVRKYEWHYRKRLSVMPGLTCIWQVSGRNQVSFERWMEMDHEYIEKWSLWLDLKILFATIPAVLFGRGAS